MYIPWWRLRKLLRRLSGRRDGEKLLRERYAELTGRQLDLADPRTFTDKMFHRLVMTNRHGNALFTQLSDKYLARGYVQSKIGDRYLVPMLWHGTDPQEIPFDVLPAKCVIKPNHASNRTLVLSTPVDRAAVIKTTRSWLKKSFYWEESEYQYHAIRRRLLIEQFLDDGHSDGPWDFKFWCFGGKPELVLVANNAHNKNSFYDAAWNALSLRYTRSAVDEIHVDKPPNLDEMLSIAGKLSADLDFVRVDLYNVHGQIYFGEFTFTPLAGWIKFQPPEWDLILGEKWVLPAEPRPVTKTG